jgi:hypothetical protein
VPANSSFIPYLPPLLVHPLYSHKNKICSSWNFPFNYRRCNTMALLFHQNRTFLHLTPISAGILLVVVCWVLYVRLHSESPLLKLPKLIPPPELLSCLRHAPSKSSRAMVCKIHTSLVESPGIRRSSGPLHPHVAPTLWVRRAYFSDGDCSCRFR